MRLVLSTAEQRQLTETTRVLLSLLDEPVDQWRRDVLRHISDLLGFPKGLFILPMGDAAAASLHNLPEESWQEYLEVYQSIDHGGAMVQRLGGGVWCTRLLCSMANASVQEAWFGSTVYREFYSRYGVRDAIGCAVLSAEFRELEREPRIVPAGVPMGAMLTCMHELFGMEEFGERGLAIMRLLQPAFEAGVTARLRHAWMQNELHEAFDTARDGLLACDADGRPVHANPALTRILVSDPESQAIRAAIEHITGALRGVLREPKKSDPTYNVNDSSSEVRTDRARYRVRGHILGAAPFLAGPAIIISVAQDSSLSRMGDGPVDLTTRETEVLRCLVHGMSYKKVATQLGISIDTVRWHIRTIYRKLRVNKAAQAVSRALQEGLV